MTAELISRWQKIRKLDEFHAMIELRFLGDILASNKKASVPAEAKDCAPNFSIEEMPW